MKRAPLILLSAIAILSCTRHNSVTPPKLSADYTVSTVASIYACIGVAADQNGAVYACDYNGNVWRIRDGVGSSLATIPESPYGSTISGMVYDGRGNLYISASRLQQILKIDTFGHVSVLAGGAPVPVDGQGLSAGFAFPQAINIDHAGFLYVIDDTAIRRIDTAGRVTTVFSKGDMNEHDGIAVDPNRNMYNAEFYLLWRIDSLGNAVVLAGNGHFGGSSIDGTGDAAGFALLTGLRLNTAGNIVAADDREVRLITPAGVVTTLAGSGATGSKDGEADSASFGGLNALAIDTAGNIYVSDGYNGNIRKISHK
jgi:hypothetical protein